MTKIPTQEVKKRTKKLADWFHTYEPYTHKLGEIQDILVTEVAHDNMHYVGHNKFYEQVLVPKNKKFMGRILKVLISDTKKHCLIGQPLDQGFSPALAPNVNALSKPGNEKSLLPVPYTLIAVVLAILVRLVWLFF